MEQECIAGRMQLAYQRALPWPADESLIHSGKIMVWNRVYGRGVAAEMRLVVYSAETPWHCELGCWV